MDGVRTLCQKMRCAWDERAMANAMHAVASSREDWTEDEFFRSGRETIAQEILTDMHNICQGRDPKQMRILEIGCGTGRLLWALADVFGDVRGVDVSGKMIELARRALADKPNVVLYENSGMDLSGLQDESFDFAFSYLVFQHIPSVEIIESYMREVHRVLRQGSLFKFQAQGVTGVAGDPEEAWIGAPISDELAVQMAYRCGFEPRHRLGAGSQFFWLWYFKREPSVLRYLEARSKCAALAEETGRALLTLGPLAADDIRTLRQAVEAESEMEDVYRTALRDLRRLSRRIKPAGRRSDAAVG